MNTITLNTVGGPVNITEKYLASGKFVDLEVEQSIHDERPDLPNDGEKWVANRSQSTRVGRAGSV